MTIIRGSYELDAVDYFDQEVSKYFEIQKEVTGVHINGTKKRIDAIIYPKKFLIDRDFPDIPIGVEIKNINTYRW